MMKTYFQNRITEEEFKRLMEKGDSFVLENVGDMEGAIRVCVAAAAARGLRCRVDERRGSWLVDGASLLPLPLQFLAAIWIIGKDLMHRGAAPHPGVLLIRYPQALHVRFRAQARVSPAG